MKIRIKEVKRVKFSLVKVSRSNGFCSIKQIKGYDRATSPVNRQGSTRVGGPLRGPWVWVVGQGTGLQVSKRHRFGLVYIRLFIYFFLTFFHFFCFSVFRERSYLLSLLQAISGELRPPSPSSRTTVLRCVFWPMMAPFESSGPPYSESRVYFSRIGA